MNTIPIVIIGAGPTGLVAANLLGKAGIETLIIERNAELCPFPRAIAIDDEGLRACQATGLSDEILAHVRLNVKAHYLSKRHFLAKVAPTAQRNGYPLITTFHQPTLEHILLKGLERFPHVKVLFQHTLEALAQDEHGVHISVRTPDRSLKEIACTYLLACDGGKSSVRRMLTVPMHSPTIWSSKKSIWHKEDEQKWLVVDGISTSEPSDTILFFCDPPRPAVSVPGPGQQRRWEFMLLPGENEEEIVQTATIQRLISHARQSMPRGFYAASAYEDVHFHIVRQAIYTFHTLNAARFVHGRVFLLGDAAHLMPPFGGQGMNSGLRDAHNLCWKLQLALQARVWESSLQQGPPLREARPTNVSSKARVWESSLQQGPPQGEARPTNVSSKARVWESSLQQGPPQGEARSTNVSPTPTPDNSILELLESYHVERHAHSQQMIVFSSLLGTIIMTRYRLLALLRDLFFYGIINRIAPLSEALTEMRIKPQPRYAHGFLWRGRGREERALVGVMLPQPYVLTASGERVRLDDVLGDDFALLSLYKEQNETRMSIRICPLGIITNKNEQPIHVMDIEQQISIFIGCKHNIHILVRPDRYIMAVFKTEKI